MPRSLLWLLPLLLSTVAVGQEVDLRVVDLDRILLSDLVDDPPPEWTDVDLGAAPPAGSSRLVSRSEIASRLRALQQTVDLATLPEAIRVVRASRRWTPVELVDWLKPEIEKRLPPHARLMGVEPPRSVTTPPRVEIGTVRVAPLPRRVGLVPNTITVELLADGRVVQRLSVLARLELAAPPPRLAIPRGAPVTLFIQTGSARVTAASTTLSAAEVGEAVSCKVLRTRKVVRARLSSPTTAEVIVE